MTTVDEETLLSISAPPKVETFHRITLEKVEGVNIGPAPVGAKYEYTYKTAGTFVALGSATKALLRDHKGEDRENWKVVESL